MTVCDDASDFNGTMLTVLASTLGTGTHNLTAAWFGNSFDRAGGNFGVSTSVTTVAGWMQDNPIDAAKPNSIHGKEIVSIAPITVNDAPAASSSSGGGSLSWPVLGLLLFVSISMLTKDRRAKLLPVKRRNPF